MFFIYSNIIHGESCINFHLVKFDSTSASFIFDFSLPEFLLNCFVTLLGYNFGSSEYWSLTKIKNWKPTWTKTLLILLLLSSHCVLCLTKFTKRYQKNGKKINSTAENWPEALGILKYEFILNLYTIYYVHMTLYEFRVNFKTGLFMGCWQC